jgi:hypothetical protein
MGFSSNHQGNLAPCKILPLPLHGLNEKTRRSLCGFFHDLFAGNDGLFKPFQKQSVIRA